jgi:transporter family protein
VTWLVASLVSAFVLGCYEVCTKHAVRENAVLPVLFLSNVVSASLWLLLLGFDAAMPEALPSHFKVAPMSLLQHGQLALKSLIVGSSWVCTYFAVKYLPISLASPIRATGPVWTLIGALILLTERPTWMEMLGIVITLFSFFGLSVAGKGEGINFRNNKWIGWLGVGVVLNSISALYDKYLLGRAGFDAPTVQCWFSIYLAVLFLPLAIGWKVRLWKRNEFHWRWSVPLLSIFLLIADYVYFAALQNPDALISLVSSLRRGSALVGFFGGVWLFKEHYSNGKLLAVIGVLAGIILTMMG